MHAATSTRSLGNFPEGVVGGGFVFIAFQRFGRWCNRCCRSRSRYWLNCSWGRALSRSRSLYTWCRRCCSYRHLRCCRNDALRGIQRRIQQHGVFTQQTAIRPEHFNQEVQVRLTHRLAGGHPNDAFAIGLEHRGEFQVSQKELTINAGFSECFRGR